MKQINSNHDKIELRSEKVRKLLGEIPPALVTWGTLILLAIFLALVLFVAFVPYPNGQGECILQHLIFSDQF